MKKSIFNKEMEDSKFKAIYDEVVANMSIGEQIAELRHKAKMSQLELAQKVNTSRTAIARYESGDYNSFNVKTLTRIAQAFHKNLKVSFSS
ncbi:MAG: helix-turn-helix transcriptional regulator [Candidatus Omnitrophica bacterium]|nr:helix-turn-helix transcriptional regulator [Candidatus Omnitrophota bacterium]